MARVPSDTKTHKLARRAQIRAKESSRLSHMRPDDSAFREPSRDKKAWRRLGLRIALFLILAPLTSAPALAWSGHSGGGASARGHHAGASGRSANWSGIYGHAHGIGSR